MENQMDSRKELPVFGSKFQQRLQVVRIAESQGTQQAAIRSGIPERTIRSWKKRLKKFGVEGLRDRSRAPKTVANKKDKDGVLTRALLDLNMREPGLTHVQILAVLMGEASNDVPSISWIKRTRKRLGLTKKKKAKTNEHKKRYEIPVPGYLQIDTKEIEKDGEPGEKLYQFTAIDECSRVRFLAGSLTKGAAAAAKFLEDAVKFFEVLGVKVLRAQTDNGTEFTLPHNELTLASYARGDTDEAAFTRKCIELGIIHRLIKPRTPQLNGKVERSHRTDEERFYSRFRFATDSALDHALKNVWMPEYNEKRPHSSLGGKTPLQFLEQKLEELKRKQQQNIIEIPRPSDEKIAA
jgi:transposase InsO family protein